MSVSLRDRVAVSAAVRGAFAIGCQDVLVSVGMMLFEPREQRWTKVETDPRVVVYRGIWRVTLSVNAFVPIVKRRRAWFCFNFACPGVLARWLVKVPVNY